MTTASSLTRPVVAASLLGLVLLVGPWAWDGVPGHWRVTSSLVGLLAIATAVRIVALAQRSGPRPSSLHGVGPLELRQTLDLGERQRMHVIGFEGRLLLIGERDGSLAVLDGGDGGNGFDDRGPDGDGAGDGGVDLRDTPRELRPQNGRGPSRSLAELRGRAAVPAPPLADFKALLERERARRRAES